MYPAPPVTRTVLPVMTAKGEDEIEPQEQLVERSGGGTGSSSVSDGEDTNHSKASPTVGMELHGRVVSGEIGNAQASRTCVD